MKSILKFFVNALLIWTIPVFFVCGLVSFAYQIPFNESLKIALDGLPAFFSGALAVAALIISLFLDNKNI